MRRLLIITTNLWIKSLSALKVPIVIVELIKYALLFLKDISGFGLFEVFFFWWFFNIHFYFTACFSFGILSLTVITHSILADTFFLPRRVKDIKLFSFHVQVFGFCFLKEGHILLFMFFYCPGNTEKERMVTSDARQRKQGRQKSVLPPVSSWRNLAKRFTFAVTECKVFSPIFQWRGCCACFGICFCPRELSLERIHAVLPSLPLYGWECLVFCLWGLLSYACWQQSMKQLKWHYSVLIFGLTPFLFFFLNKSDPFFEQKSLWMCAALEYLLVETYLPAYQNSFWRSLQAPAKPLLWLEQTMWLVVFKFLCCFSPYISMTAYQWLKFHASCRVVWPSCPLIHASDEHSKDLWS